MYAADTSPLEGVLSSSDKRRKNGDGGTSKSVQIRMRPPTRLILEGEKFPGVVSATTVPRLSTSEDINWGRSCRELAKIWFLCCQKSDGVRP
jgi:hypothetical protein